MQEPVPSPAHMGCSFESATSCLSIPTAVGSCLCPRQNATSCRNKSDWSSRAAVCRPGASHVLAVLLVHADVVQSYSARTFDKCSGCRRPSHIPKRKQRPVLFRQGSSLLCIFRSSASTTSSCACTRVAILALLQSRWRKTCRVNVRCAAVACADVPSVLVKNACFTLMYEVHWYVELNKKVRQVNVMCCQLTNAAAACSVSATLYNNRLRLHVQYLLDCVEYHRQ